MYHFPLNFGPRITGHKGMRGEVKYVKAAEEFDVREVSSV
jgi:hypothetical protein